MAGCGTANGIALSPGTVAPTAQEYRAALACAAIVLLAFAALAPFAARQLMRLDSFVPAVEAIILVTDLATAILLFNHFAIVGSRALLMLASGYLFAALIVVPHVLTYPGVFAPTGLLGAGLQTTPWLYIFWHFGFAAAVITYACFGRVTRSDVVARPARLPAIGLSATIVGALVIALVWLVTADERFMPRLFLDDLEMAPLGNYIAGINLSMSIVALVLVWIRRHSVLDLWLMVGLCALVAELATVTFILTSRFSLGFYLGRAFSIVVSTAVLAMLLAETAKLYARLSRADRAIRRERELRQMSLEVAVAEIAHKVRQPLMSIAAAGAAARRFLDRVPPDVDRLKGLHEDMVRASFRANGLFERILPLFENVDVPRRPVDVNELISAALEALRGELKSQSIAVRLDLTPELPLVTGDERQLLEVILNLMQNAVDATGAAAADRVRILRIGTEPHGLDAVAISVEDSGPGIDPKEIAGIFDAFVTTREGRLGLGLAISRMIVERHRGRLWATCAADGGARVEVVLPVGSVA